MVTVSSAITTSVIWVLLSAFVFCSNCLEKILSQLYCLFQTLFSRAAMQAGYRFSMSFQDQNYKTNKLPNIHMQRFVCFLSRTGFVKSWSSSFQLNPTARFVLNMLHICTMWTHDLCSKIEMWSSFHIHRNLLLEKSTSLQWCQLFAS